MAKAPKKRFDWGFDTIKPGESKYFEGKNPNTISMAFCYFLGKGRYQVLQEGNGYRFHWLKTPKGGSNAEAKGKGKSRS